jgi:hypothetical protein
VFTKHSSGAQAMDNEIGMDTWECSERHLDAGPKTWKEEAIVKYSRRRKHNIKRDLTASGCALNACGSEQEPLTDYDAVMSIRVP